MKTKHNHGINYDGHKNFGLTKREWFTGMALQGLLANSFDNSSICKPVSLATRHELASLAVEQADAVIAYLNNHQRDEVPV